ncbi:glycine cleavage system H protein, mitochondrial [Atheta coriaria]|uniref:glycine cleavage system H protein, mitochondrial n=1 Tax=Dalotia coriaria TaxID=877792 RepID=UPI0031F4582D
MALPRIVLRANKLINQTVFSQIANVNKCETLRLISTARLLCAERRYTDKHEWIEVDGNVGIVGISQYAQEALGDVVYAQLPEAATELNRGDECGALESVKAASEIYSPVSGKVMAKNKDVEDTPALINNSCYEKGWLYKIELKDAAEVKNLMTEEKYKEFLKTADH